MCAKPWCTPPHMCRHAPLVAIARREMLVIGTISRPALIRRLTGSPHPAVTLLTAPAGCGKTSLLAEWAAADARRFAWVQITPADDDPLHLLRSIAGAVGVAETPERRGTKALS